VAEEIARGWMSISGIINTHFIVAYLISRHGTAEQTAAFLPKMATGEIDTTELILDDCRVPAARVLGERPGQGFYQMMDGIEVGRVNVAARACGVAHRAFELAISYAQQRQAFGKPIAQHQAIEFKLAEMGTKVVAAHQMMVMSARRKDQGRKATSRPAWPSTWPASTPRKWSRTPCASTAATATPRNTRSNGGQPRAAEKSRYRVPMAMARPAAGGRTACRTWEL
jgi:alkylation response protein AidB-like acyl-CoA dehydrogenase